MEKKSINVHALTVHMYAVAIIVLVLLLLVLGVKYVHLKMAVKNYTQSAIYLNEQNKPDMQLGDYGVIISESILMVPQANLQKYVSDLSTDIKRQIIVLDKSKKILASSNPVNVGKAYAYDLNDNINMTLADGEIRSFDEKSEDFPGGINMIAIPTKNAQGQINGVVLISNSKLSE